MPRDRETPLARFAHTIANEEGWSFGTPSLSDRGSTVALPILKAGRRARRCLLGSEATDQVSAVDSGRIGRLRVRNDTAHRLFLPPGTLFRGKQTASRGTTAGVVLDPQSTSDVEVRCVHQSCPVVSDAVLHLAGPLAPNLIRHALISRDQGLVWASVSKILARPQALSSHPPHKPDPRAIDDLVGALSEGRPPSREPYIVIPGGRKDENACGIILLDPAGVVFLEIFDSAESWKAASRLIPESATPQPPSLGFSSRSGPLDRDKLIRLAKDFLTPLGDVECQRVASSSWAALDASSEYTELDGEIVHLVAFGGENPWSPRFAGDQRVSGDGWVAAAGPDLGALRLGQPQGMASGSDGEVVAAVRATTDLEDDSEPFGPVTLPRRRKVLTSGWDVASFESLERYSRKEFGGDRSAAVRSLVRQGLDRRGYFGPRPPPQRFVSGPPRETEATPPGVEKARVMAETRIRDLQRIVQTDVYAEWLRKRARLELERMASSIEDESLQEVAQTALERLPSIAAVADVSESLDVVAVPPPHPPPLDVRPLLRRAFSASAAGQYAGALRLFDDVLDAEPENRTALLGRAVALRRSGKSQEALVALDLVLEIEPANAAALLNRGRILQERGDFAGAVEVLDRLAAVAPNDWDVWVARGDVLTRMGQDRDALAAYSEALRRNPDDEHLKTKIRGLERSRSLPPGVSSSSAALPRDVHEGQSYLVKEGRLDLSYRVFRTLASRSVPSLLITHRSFDRVTAESAPGSLRVLYLSQAPGENHVAPTSLAFLTNAIERFVTEHRGRAAILLDGLGPLVESNGTRDTVLFIERVNEAILPSQAIFLVSLTPGSLAEKEIAILERDLRVLS